MLYNSQKAKLWANTDSRIKRFGEFERFKLLLGWHVTNIYCLDTIYFKSHSFISFNWKLFFKSRKRTEAGESYCI